VICNLQYVSSQSDKHASRCKTRLQRTCPQAKLFVCVVGGDFEKTLYCLDAIEWLTENVQMSVSKQRCDVVCECNFSCNALAGDANALPLVSILTSS